jgi:hypothetical protein
MMALALVFVPGTAHTQDKGVIGKGAGADSEITLADMKQILTNMGYEVKEYKNDKGELVVVSITVSYDTWTVPVNFSLSGSKKYMWMTTGLVAISKPDSIPPKALMGLLVLNTNLAFFSYSETYKRFELASFLRNNGINATTTKFHLDAHRHLFLAGEPYWNPNKW